MPQENLSPYRRPASALPGDPPVAHTYIQQLRHRLEQHNLPDREQAPVITFPMFVPASLINPQAEIAQQGAPQVQETHAAATTVRGVQTTFDGLVA